MNPYIKQFPDLMSGKKIMYVHGFLSSAQSGTVKMLQELMPNATLVAEDIPVHPEEAIEMLQKMAETEQPDLIIGTSMGGMYTELLKGFDRILVNPAFEMGNTMSSMTGKQEFQNPRKDGVNELMVTKGLIKEYRDFTERITIRFNWNASTTVQLGQRYFSKVLTDGPISRINFCTIPEREIGAEMPVYGEYDDAFREALRPYIENLCKASGRIDCAEAFALAEKLKEENADFSRMSQNRVFENLSFRGNVIAFLKACVLYVANGCKWEPEIEEFIRWSESYDLWRKMIFFGTGIAKANEVGEKSSKRGPTNLLQLLPDTFTYTQAEMVRLQNDFGKKGTAMMLRNWVNRHYIEKIPPKGANADGGDRKQGGKVFSIQLFSFKKLLFRSDGLDLRCFNAK